MTPSYSLELLSVLNTARFQDGWSVLLVPSSRYKETLLTISALCDLPVSGRTIVWPDMGNKLSVVHTGQEKILPEGHPYTLFVAGWSQSSPAESGTLKEWRTGAKEFVSIEARA